MYLRYGKRLLDIVLVVVAAPVWVPVWVVSALAVALLDGRPAHFRQDRIGLDEKTFKLVKLRTMREGPGNDMARLTRAGRWMRRTSLDEIPQLLNVLRGDMSLVGPRPLFVRYLPYYHEHERARHSVRPGITGLAQVRGRNKLLWEERLGLDAEYANQVTLVMDLRILMETLRGLLSSSDIHIIPGEHQPPLDAVRARGSS